METAITVKRPRGRPRTDASPRSDVHARLPAALKARLERDAKRARRSVAKEFEIRLEKSYLHDEMYGGPQMAVMFRQMAEVALGVARQKNRGSVFEDFETFVVARDVWQLIIQRQMPRPDEQLLAEVCREWDAFKAGSLQTATQRAVREWLIHHTPMTITSVQGLAGLHEPRISRSVGRREPADDKPSGPKATKTGEPALPPKPLFSRGPVPPIGSLGEAMEGFIPSEGEASAASPGSNWPIGSLAKAIESLIPAQGSVRAAAEEVSRLAQILADASEKSAAGDTVLPPIGSDKGVVAVRK